MSAEKGYGSRETQNDEKLLVSLAYGEVRTEFSGSPEVVLNAINSFIGKQIPELSLAKKLYLNFAARELVEKFQDYVRITPEGPRVWPGERKLSDKEMIALQLVAQRIFAETGSESAPKEMSLAELQDTTALNPKSLSSRLSEMTKAGQVQRESRKEGGTFFRITTSGIDWLHNTLIKRV